MKLPDVNILLYAKNSDALDHVAARRWLEEELSGAEPVGFAWMVLLGFLRISTRMPSPLAAAEALDTIDGWLERPNAEIIHPTRRHPSLLRELVERCGTAGNLTSDAHLAALAIEQGATLSSFDGDFHRFDGLRFEYLR